MSQEELISQVREAVKTDPNKDYIHSLYLFGSFLHGDATDKSDVDLIVDLKKSLGYFRLMEIQNHLEDVLEKPVDLTTKDGLSKYIRDDVLKEAKKIY